MQNNEKNKANNDHKSQKARQNLKDSACPEQKILAHLHYSDNQLFPLGEKRNTKEKPESSFSIRKWISEEKQEIGTQQNNSEGWLFITAWADKILLNLFSHQAKDMNELPSAKLEVLDVNLSNRFKTVSGKVDQIGDQLFLDFRYIF